MSDVTPAERAAQLAGIILLGAALAVFIGRFIPDDAFISYRFADNLAAGHGLAYNPGDPPIEGYSNALWVLLLAAGRLLGIAPDALAPVLGIAAAIGTLVVALLAFGTVPALLIAASAPFVVYAASGMETPLFCLLVLLLVALLARERFLGASLVAALVVLCRPEGIVVVPVVAALAAWNADRRGVIAVAGMIIAVVAYHAWRWAYFGSIVPMSAGKAVDSVGRAQYAIRLLFADGMHGVSPVGGYYLLVAIVLFGAGARRLSAASVIAAALALVSVLVIDWMPGGRYLVPALVLVVASAGARMPKDQRAYAVALVLAANLSFAATLRADVRNRMSDFADLESVAALLPVAFPDARIVCTPDVGLVPYRTGWYARDTWVRPLVSRGDPLFGRGIVHVLFSTSPETVAVQADLAPYLARIRASGCVEVPVPRSRMWTGRRPIVFAMESAP